MELTPITRKEHFLAKAAGDPNAKELEPITREEYFISQIQGGSGGGAVSSVNGKTGTVVLTASDVGAAGVYHPTLVGPSFTNDDLEEGIYFEIYFDNGVPYLNFFGISGDESVILSNIENPKGPYNAANKQYVDGYKVNISNTTPTITPAANTIYKCGTLTSLTITDPPATGAYSIVFTSGSTATTTTIPATILGLEDFAAEANTIYEINVLDNRAVVGSWAVSA